MVHGVVSLDNIYGLRLVLNHRLSDEVVGFLFSQLNSRRESLPNTSATVIGLEQAEIDVEQGFLIGDEELSQVVLVLASELLVLSLPFGVVHQLHYSVFELLGFFGL